MNADVTIQEHMPTTSSAEASVGSNPRSTISVVSPAYNEADNLLLLYERLHQILDSTGLSWEWLIIDDHSADATFAVAADLSKRNSRTRVIRLARNSGAHTAIVCGLDHAHGDGVVVLAADLQDPPEVIPMLLEQWRSGAQVVWATRAHREGEKATTLGFARMYYFLMRRIVGIQDIPATGADFFLIDRCVVDALSRFNEKNVSILALITWMGFRQSTITYDKLARAHGRSGWSLEKKLKLVVDSTTSFTYLPIRLMSYFGSLIALLGFLYAGIVVYNGLRGLTPEGWSSLMVVVLIIGGSQMLMMGVLGEYLWRALDEVRQRPRYLIESMTDDERRS